MSSNNVKIGEKLAVDCGVISFDAYADRVLELRNAALYAPIGMEWQGRELADDYQGVKHVGAFVAGALIGVARLRLCPGSTDGLIQRVAVDPTKIEHGVGSTLIPFAETHFRRMPAYTAIVHARRGTEEFYARLGYEDTGHAHEYSHGRVTAIMRKHLD